MELGLAGKTVVITGGGTGIGKATALAFLEEGCRVAICGRRQAKLDAAKEEFAEKGYAGRVLALQADALSEETMGTFAAATNEAFGGIHIWINNAGANKIKSLIDFSADEFRQIVDANLITVFVGCKTAYPYLKEQGGVILNAASFAAVAANAGRAPYSAAKAGVLSLTKTFAAEFAKDSIRVLAYIPGMIETEITVDTISRYKDDLLRDIPARRFGRPEDLASVLVFMASDRAGYINGTQIEISGGKRCVQNPMYAFSG